MVTSAADAIGERDMMANADTMVATRGEQHGDCDGHSLSLRKQLVDSLCAHRQACIRLH